MVRFFGSDLPLECKVRDWLIRKRQLTKFFVCRMKLASLAILCRIFVVANASQDDKRLLLFTHYLD